MGVGSGDRAKSQSDPPAEAAAIAVSPAETPTIHTEVQVMFFDTDCAAVVHNIAYLRFIETARTLLAEQMGMGLAQMAESALFPVVARTEIDYRRPAKLADRLVISGRLEVLERIRFWCGFTIHRPADGAVIAQSRQMLALVQMPSGRPVPVPTEWLQKWAHLRPVRGGKGDAR